MIILSLFYRLPRKVKYLCFQSMRFFRPLVLSPLRIIIVSAEQKSAADCTPELHSGAAARRDPQMLGDCHMVLG